MKQTELEKRMLEQIRAAKLPEPTLQYMFALPFKRWRCDMAWLDIKVILEVEGGIWTNGGHARGSGISRDIARHNYATLKGWRVFRVTSNMIDNTAAIKLVKNIFAQYGIK